MIEQSYKPPGAVDFYLSISSFLSDEENISDTHISSNAPFTWKMLSFVLGWIKQQRNEF